MSIFVSYIFLGLSLAAPIGPINAAQLNKGLRSGFWHSWLVGLGAMIADMVYMLLVYFGVVHFLSTPFMQTFLWLFGWFVLCYTGIESLIGAGKIANARDDDESALKSFFSGFLMSLSNPLTILFWLGIYGSVLAKTAKTAGPQELVLYSCAIMLGVVLWDITMASMASTFRKYLTARLLTLISVLSGLSLIGFGLYFGLEACKMLFFR